tara:strand:- start:1360 stop:1767 length:408 start_codon:yes stop_codon:yes gene_type:complete
MDKSKYVEIIKKGKRVDWYGVEVPKDLLTNLVIVWSTGLKKEIDKLESTLTDLKGVSLDKRKQYIKSLMYNLQNAPYSLNGDTYLKKKKAIELEIEEEKVKNVKKRNIKTTKPTKSGHNTKNSNLIFGKNKTKKK